MSNDETINGFERRRDLVSRHLTGGTKDIHEDAVSVTGPLAEISNQFVQNLNEL